ncbi:hypothetical protein Acy02nite_92270 [Actinoplanes cyaneus]|uniref:Uncharacterized protein n=1 Tax=Actinoplanes cyaneus TaxID=52696 RepID=A0A919MHJ7_9ACTN|nr:hypothetical protein Acy02nite_92270 [Actinoplanes cyaneus]
MLAGDAERERPCYQDGKPNDALCGTCGRLLDDRHGVDDHREADSKVVEYVVVGRRGGIAEFREAAGDSKVRKTDAATLAFQLGIDNSTLLGCRFSCRVERAEYGVIRSGFTLLTE